MAKAPTFDEIKERIETVLNPETEVASGDKSTLRGLGTYEKDFDEGSRGILELRLSRIPPGTDAILNGIDASLKGVGVKLWRSSEVLEDRRIRFYFEKGLGPLALLAAMIAGGVLLFALTSWVLFKTGGIEEMLPFILIVGGVVVLGIIALVVALKVGGSISKFIPVPE